MRRVLSAWVRAAEKAERGTVWGRRGIARKEGVRGGGHHGAGGEGGGAAADRSRPGRPHIASPPVTVTSADSLTGWAHHGSLGPNRAGLALGWLHVAVAALLSRSRHGPGRCPYSWRVWTFGMVSRLGCLSGQDRCTPRCCPLSSPTFLLLV